MREIKFRAHDGKQMHENVVIIDGVAYKRYYFANIFNPDAKAGIPMQYTGLHDRKGVAIYEADVLQNVSNPHVDKEPFAIIWLEDSASWGWRDLEGGVDTFYQTIADSCEVVGNIYDNAMVHTH